MSGGCPSFKPATIQELIQEQEYGLVLGEYKMQMIRYRELDDYKLSAFQNFGGVVHNNAKIPEELMGRRSQKRNYADIIENEQEEVEDTRPMKISAIAWHPFKPKLAVAVRESGIYFYNQDQEQWQSETYSDMGNIYDIEYGPLGSCLGVACEDGVYIWRSRKQPRSVPDSDISGLHKTHCSFRGAKGLRFSPCGAYVAVWSESALRIFSTAQLKESVKVHTSFTGIIGCDWGPQGLLLSHKNKFYLYDTDTWQCRSYSSTHGVVSGIAGFPTQMFLFSTQRYLQWLMLKDEQEEIGVAFDLTIPGAQPNDMIPKDVILSPCCTRIAVTYDYEASKCPLSASVAVIAVEKTMLVPVGFIHGHSDWGSALQCTFRTLPKGTLLTIFWGRGFITFHHLLSGK